MQRKGKAFNVHIYQILKLSRFNLGVRFLWNHFRICVTNLTKIEHRKKNIPKCGQGGYGTFWGKYLPLHLVHWGARETIQFSKNKCLLTNTPWTEAWQSIFVTNEARHSTCVTTVVWSGSKVTFCDFILQEINEYKRKSFTKELQVQAYIFEHHWEIFTCSS